MPVIQCHHCNARIKVPDDKLGAEIECPKCQGRFVAIAATTPRTAQQELALLEARASAKEVASKYIGKHAIPWIVLLVAMGVGSSYFLNETTLPAVIGLVSTAVMALIALMTGITGLKEKEERPEFKVITDLITRLDRPTESMRVEVDGDIVRVRHGDNIVSATRVTTDHAGRVQLENVHPEPPGGSTPS